MRDVEEYVISMADKAQEDIVTQEVVRLGMDSELISGPSSQRTEQEIRPLQNISPSKDNWIGSGSGLSGVAYN